MISCRNNSNKSNIKQLSKITFPDFQEKNTGLGNFLKNQDTLIITIEFSNCGEWGGHKESIILTRNSNNKIIGHFIVDSVSCENIKNSGNYSDLDDNSRVIIKSIETELNKNDEKLINLFIHRILELSLNQGHDIYTNTNGEEIIPTYEDSGTTIKIQNSNSTLKIFYWNISENRNTWYGKIRKEIFGKVNK